MLFIVWFFAQVCAPVIGVRFCFPLFWRDWREGSLLFVMHPALCSMSLVWFVNIL